MADFHLPKAFPYVTIAYKSYAIFYRCYFYAISYLYSLQMSCEVGLLFFIWQLKRLLTPQGVQLIINRTGIYSNNMQGQGIILEDSRLNFPSCCYMKHMISKIRSKNDVVCVLRKHFNNQDLLFLILLYHKLS